MKIPGSLLERPPTCNRTEPLTSFPCPALASSFAIHDWSKTMPRFTIETTYRMPYYRHGVYDAATPEEACRLAIEDDDWSCELPDHECAGPTYVTGIWKGGGAAYEGSMKKLGVVRRPD